MIAVHPLLARQLRKAFAADATPSRELEALLASIDSAYVAADDDRKQLERSLHLASEELYERNRRLERELEERKRLEVELQHAEKLRAVGQLAAGVAHEINTPIQYIGDSLSFLVEAFEEINPLLSSISVAGSTWTPPAGPRSEDLAFLCVEIPRALKRSHDGVDRIATIVRALKTLAYPNASEPEHAELGAAIENTLIVVGSQLRYVADAHVELGSTRTVRCHIGEIQQVLLALLVNAAHAIRDRVKATGGRGTVRIVTSDDGPDVVLTIADDGTGIPRELQARIFEPFFTTKPVGEGTGQGLSLSRSLIVEHHGGQLSFASEVGAGTTFTIRLPVNGRAGRTDQVFPDPDRGAGY